MQVTAHIITNKLTGLENSETIAVAVKQGERRKDTKNGNFKLYCTQQLTSTFLYCQYKQFLPLSNPDCGNDSVITLPPLGRVCFLRCLILTTSPSIHRHAIIPLLVHQGIICVCMNKHTDSVKLISVKYASQALNVKQHISHTRTQSKNQNSAYKNMGLC